MTDPDNIRILRNVHDRHPLRRIACRTGAVIAIVGFIVSMILLNLPPNSGINLP